MHVTFLLYSGCSGHFAFCIYNSVFISVSELLMRGSYKLLVTEFFKTEITRMFSPPPPPPPAFLEVEEKNNYSY